MPLPHSPSQAPAPRFSEEALFALNYLAGIDSGAPVPVQAHEEQAVADFAREIGDVDERLAVLAALSHVARDRSGIRPALEMAEDEKWGSGVLEVGFADMPKAVERSLKGKNPYVVVRAGEWADLAGRNTGDVIAASLTGVGDFTKAGEEHFPKPSMPTESSGLHLDNFIMSWPSGFRYAFSAAQVNDGAVLFIGGFARGKALNTAPKQEGVAHPYEVAMLNLENAPTVQGAYAAAKQGRPKSRAELGPINGTQLTAVVLREGDVVIWPQGGPGSELPDWHGFRKIGNQDRQSTSYHFVQAAQPPTAR